MSTEYRNTTTTGRQDRIDHPSSVAQVAIPPGHVGEFVIPGTGRRVWWTGRVAIGLLHKPARCEPPTSRRCGFRH